MRPLLTLTLLLLAVSACDTSGTDPTPYAGVIELSLSPEVKGGPTALRLIAVGDTGCNDPFIVETDASPGRLDVRVVGIVRPTGVTCAAAIPAQALVPLPFVEQGGFPITVAHRGSTDEYAYSIGFAGERLDAVRTSTTRLAAP